MTTVKRFGNDRREETAGAVTCWATVILIETKVITLRGKIKLTLLHIGVYVNSLESFTDEFFLSPHKKQRINGTFVKPDSSLLLFHCT